MVRIIGGLYKHRMIDQPSIENTRATKDSAKEGLFNSLGDISKKTFLDLFSGSGSVGIEAISRGASYIYLNDNNKEAYKIIKSNLDKLNIKDYELKSLNDLDYINDLKSRNIKLDYIFLDPPYKYKIDNLYLLNLKELLNDNSVIIIESDEIKKAEDFKDFKIKVLKYGKTYMNILRRL